jgi:hypothetical protein
MTGTISAKCFLCGARVGTITHEFVVGNLPGKPAWTVEAPMYWAASGEGPGTVRPFCSPRCATAVLAARATLRTETPNDHP